MFTGFSPETGEFLWGLAFHNERPWFLEHKQEFDKFLMEPFKALAQDTAALFRERYPDLDVQLHISRIYRDARRLHGRGPYKEHLWFSIKSWEGLLCGPMFWFEIGAADYGFGMGFYSATPRQMEAYRQAVEANPARLERLAERLLAQNTFVLEGELYKHPKGDLGPLLNPWYQRKWLGLACHRDFDESLYDLALPRKLADGFQFLMPYYEYFMDTCTPEPEQ